MSPLAEIGLIAGRELRKSIRSVKGIILFALSILGGLGITMLMILASRFVNEQQAKAGGIPDEALLEMKAKILIDLYGEEQGRFLAAVPTVMFLMYNVMVGLAPLFIVLMGFDIVSGETQHRTVRYWTVRTHRTSYYVGKFLGLWTVNAMVWLTMSVVTWIVATARGDASLGDCVSWGTRMWLITLPMSGVWAAFVMLVASQFRRPMISLLVTLGAVFGIWLVNIVNGVLYKTGKVSVRPFFYLYPNSYEDYLLTANVGRFAIGLSVCLAMIAAYGGLGIWRFKARDV